VFKILGRRTVSDYAELAAGGARSADAEPLEPGRLRGAAPGGTRLASCVIYLTFCLALL
jgi:hypothetical protein